ncbi:MAG: hypothetical protein ACK4P2_05605 [Hyphomonas sp.]
MISEKLFFYCLATFAVAWAWAMLHLDKRSSNAINMSGLTRLTGAVSFYVDVALIVGAFFVFQFPLGFAAIAASVVGAWLSALVDPLRRNAMTGSSNFLFAFAGAQYFYLDDPNAKWLLFMSWAFLGVAGALFVGAFLGPSQKTVIEQARAQFEHPRKNSD